MDEFEGIANPQDALRSRWLHAIDQAFGTRPRDGTIEGTVWLHREEYERRLFDLLATDTPHVCVDGPTGTGKTSLVTTQLHRLKRKYVYVQLAHGMTWPEFCRELIRVSRPEGKRPSGEIEATWEGMLPRLSYRKRLGESVGAIEEDLTKISAAWKVHDICAMLQREDLVLFIDDFEKVLINRELLVSISDLCKIATSQEYGKVILVGTGSIFFDLMETDSALEGRIQEVSVSAVESSRESWRILEQGFEKLGFSNPATRLRRKRRDPIFQRELQECVFATYLAAGGLLKQINQLGSRICRGAIGRITSSTIRTTLSKHDILSESKKVQRENFEQYRLEFPEIRRIVEKHLEVRAVLKLIYEEGINKIHSVAHIKATLFGSLTESQVMFAIKQIRGQGLFTIGGRSGDIVFSNKPTLLHAFGVACARPNDYGDAAKGYQLFGQLSLPYLD